MGRFYLNPRPVYRDNEPTGGERVMAGIQGGLDWYAGRREAARQEGNQVGAAGGVKLPDEAQPSIGQRIRGIGSALGDVIHGRLPGLPNLQPTGTFAGGPAQQGGTFMPGPAHAHPTLDAPGNPDQMVTDAIMGRPYGNVVAPTPPVGALPPSPRGSLAGPVAPMGGPMLYDQSYNQPERTYTHEGADGARYQMPQAGERERTNKMLEYGAEVQAKDALKHQDEEEQIAALVAGGMSATEARARVLNNVVRYDDEYGQRRGNGLNLQEREELMRLEYSLKQKVATGNATSADRAQLREIQRRRLALDEQKYGTSLTRSAGQLDAQAAAIEDKGVVRNPIDRRMNDRNPQAKASNDAREQRVEQGVQNTRDAAAQLRNQRATREQAAARAKELQAQRKSPAEIKRIMQSEGYQIR